MERKIIRNSAECLICHDHIESTHIHDFKRCTCKNIYVDGGKNYIKRGYSTNQWRDTSLFEDIIAESLDK